jgi:beta-lactamase superfamily II metal-dependent hydrolase
LRVTEDYAYEAFTTSVPQYLKVTAINFIEGPEIDAPEAATDVQPLPGDNLANGVRLTGFHVGQGMSSLLSSPSHNHGYLLDAGGGTPVLRESYRAGRHFGGVFKNDLAFAIGHLQHITVVLSHSDCDHWRILDWDLELLAKVERIFLPVGRPALVFHSHRVKLRTKGLGDAKLWLGNVELDVLRSEPRINDENGHCLIVHAKQGKRSALLPGDYVYSRMLRDERPDKAISALGGLTFDAIVVPHHGDKASAKDVFSPRVHDQSIAFFSAGDHEGYGHPTLLSIDAHFLKKFAVVDMLSPNIVACTLLS